MGKDGADYGVDPPAPPCRILRPTILNDRAGDVDLERRLVRFPEGQLGHNASMMACSNPLANQRRCAHYPSNGREAGNRGSTSAASRLGRQSDALGQWRDRPDRRGR